MEVPARILIVDDEPGVIAALERCFSDAPYRLLTAASAVEGLALLRQQGGCALVISDYRMPGMDGVTFLQQVMRHWPAAGRMILSAYTDAEILLAAVNQGRVHRFLTKPWKNDTLLTEVAALLQEIDSLDAVRREVEALVRRNELLAATNLQLQQLLDNLLKAVRSQYGAGKIPADAAPAFPSPCSGQLAGLSGREQQVLARMAAGRRPKETAQELGISIKTVSTYKQRLAEKLGCRSDAELIACALRHRLQPRPDNM